MFNVLFCQSSAFNLFACVSFTFALNPIESLIAHLGAAAAAHSFRTIEVCVLAAFTYLGLFPYQCSWGRRGIGHWPIHSQWRSHDHLLLPCPFHAFLPKGTEGTRKEQATIGLPLGMNGPVPFPPPPQEHWKKKVPNV